MSKNTRNMLIGLGVSLATGFLLGLMNSYVEARTGRAAGTDLPTWLLPVLFGTFTYLILQGLSGNRKVAMADAAERDRALSFTPEPGRSLLVFVREGFVGKAVGVNVHVDGATVAQLKSPRFTAVSVAPGVHQLTADCQTTSGTVTALPYEIRVEPGETAVMRLGIAMGMVKGNLKFERETDMEAVRRKLRSVPMVAPDAAGAF